jgi:hypothetical protein
MVIFWGYCPSFSLGLGVVIVRLHKLGLWMVSDRPPVLYLHHFFLCLSIVCPNVFVIRNDLQISSK